MTTDHSRSNPYVGPRAFKTGETLYGRDNELNELLHLLIAERIVLLHSPSGAGKSSLIYAGLIPRLWEEGFQVLPVARVNLEPPAEGLKLEGGFNRYVYSILASFDEALPEEERLPLDKLMAMSLPEYLDQFKIPAPVVTQGPDDLPPMDAEVLIFDQFEEVLTTLPTDLEGKSAFFSQLGAALRNRKRWAVFVMREDYIAALDPYLRPLPTRLSNTFRLDLLGVDASLEAIKLPAMREDVSFTETAARKLVDDLRQVQMQRPDGTIMVELGPYVEPVQLQVVCYRLWQNHDVADHEISVEDVLSIGDVNESLGEYYADTVHEVAEESGVQERAIRVWFDEKLITESGIRSQVLMEPDQSGELDNRAIRLLENAHLVRAEKRRGATWFELAHDRLLDPVRTSNAAWFQAHLSLLQRQASLWQKDNRPDHLLLREQALLDAEGWAAEHSKQLSPVDKDFLEACLQQRAREEEARAAAERERLLKLEAAEKVAAAERLRAEEAAQSAKKLRTRLIMATVAFILALFFAGAAAFTGFQARQTSFENQTLAAKAQEASILAVGNAATAEANAIVAQVASTLANQQKATAVYAEGAARQAEGVAQDQRATAVYNSELALAQANLARSRELASLASDYVETRSDLALLLSIEAYRKAETSQALDALLRALQRQLSREVQKADQTIPTQPISVNSISASPDGHHLAWAGVAGLMRVWDFQLQKVLWERYSNSESTITAMQYSPDGKLIATADVAGGINFYDAQTGKPVRVFRPEIVTILTMAYSPDGSRLAYGGVSQGNKINLFVLDLYTGRVSGFNIRPLKTDVLSVAWSPDSRLLASGGRDSILRIWDVETQEQLQVFQGYEGPVKSVAFSPTGQWLATGANDETAPIDKNILLWDVSLCDRPTEAAQLQQQQQQKAILNPWEDPTCRMQLPVAFLGQETDINTIAFSPDGLMLATGDTRGTTLLWDVRTRIQIAEASRAAGVVSSVAFVQVEDKLVLATGSLDRTIQLNNLESTDSLVSFSQNVEGVIGSLTFSADDTLHALSGGEGTALWNGNAAGEISPGSTFPLGSEVLALSGDGRSFAVLQQDDQGGRIEVWGTSGDTSQLTIPAPEGTLISISEDAAGALITETLTTSLDTITSLAMNADGSLVAAGVCAERNSQLNTCAVNQIHVWGTGKGGTHEQYATQHNSPIISLAFSADGRILATGGANATIYLYEVDGGTQLGLGLIGQGGPVTALAFNADGTRLASGSSSSLLALWDVDSAQLIGDPLSGTSGSITALAFSPDGKTLVAGSDNGSLAWMSLDRWLEQACQYAGRNFDDAEWQQFFKDEQYRQTCEVSSG